MECASALHQPDGVGSQGCHIDSGEFNCVPIALMARSGVLSSGSGPRRCNGLVWWWWWDDGLKDVSVVHGVEW